MKICRKLKYCDENQNWNRVPWSWSEPSNSKPCSTCEKLIILGRGETKQCKPARVKKECQASHLAGHCLWQHQFMYKLGSVNCSITVKSLENIFHARLFSRKVLKWCSLYCSRKKNLDKLQLLAKTQPKQCRVSPLGCCAARKPA